MPREAINRRQFLATGLGAAAALVSAGALHRSWGQLAREDLIPGSPPDIHLEPRRWTVTDDFVSIAVIGDNGSGGRQAVEVAAAMALSYQRQPFGLVSMLGDICYYGPISERFDEVFARPMNPLIEAGVQFELAVGNHDGRIFWEEGVPDVEETLRALGTPGRYYAVSRGPVDLFYLDSGSLGLQGVDGLDQIEWLDDALSGETRPWRIVCSHHPVHSSGSHGSTPRLNELLEPVLVRHDVDLFLAGHDHHYERTEPIDGVVHVVSGGGCKLTPVYPSSYTAAATSSLQFMRITADGDRLAGASIGVDGTPLDQFELRAKDRR